MRRLPALALLPVLGLLAAFLYRAREAEATRDFQLQGTVRLHPRFMDYAQRSSNVLVVVARGGGGMPVAVQRILHPQFPMRFSLSREDLVLPGARTAGPLQLQAALTTHGQPGLLREGDLEGWYPVPVRLGDGPVPITLDRVRQGETSQEKQNGKG